MPRLAVLSVLSSASSPCPDLNLIHYKSYHLPHSNNNIKGRLKTLIEDFQTTFVFAGWPVRILKIQFRFQPISTRHADYGEAAVVLAALYLPVVFVEQVFHRAADGQGIFTQLGFVTRAYVN